MPTGPEALIEAPTPFGPVWFRTHDTGRPVLLFISGDGTPDEVRSNEDVISAYLGTSH